MALMNDDNRKLPLTLSSFSIFDDDDEEINRIWIGQIWKQNGLIARGKRKDVSIYNITYRIYWLLLIISNFRFISFISRHPNEILPQCRTMSTATVNSFIRALSFGVMHNLHLDSMTRKEEQSRWQSSTAAIYHSRDKRACLLMRP